MCSSRRSTSVEDQMSLSGIQDRPRSSSDTRNGLHRSVLWESDTPRLQATQPANIEAKAAKLDVNETVQN